MSRVAVLVVLSILFASCGGGDDPAPETDTQEEVTDISRQVAQELGFTEEQFEEYESDTSLVLGDLRAFWTNVLPQLFGIEHTSPSAFLEYHGVEDG